MKHLNNPNTFIECSNTIYDVYENIYIYKKKMRIFMVIIQVEKEKS